MRLSQLRNYKMATDHPMGIIETVDGEITVYGKPESWWRRAGLFYEVATGDTNGKEDALRLFKRYDFDTHSYTTAESVDRGTAYLRKIVRFMETNKRYAEFVL